MESSYLDELIANPGAESVRRAYATWLAARGDCRSDYLLAELDLGRTRQRPAEERVRELAAPLDPVWVARVSRPPIGVCTDHVRFRDTLPNFPRPHLEAQRLDWIESRFHLRLPVDYRAFLLNYNGGQPEPAYFRVPGRAYAGDRYELQGVFLSDLHPLETENDNDGDLIFRLQFLEEVRKSEAVYRDETRRWRGHPHRDFMVVGYSSPYDELSWLCLGCRGDMFGQLFYVAPWLQEPTSPDYCFVAPTFATFLGMLTGGDEP